MTLEDNIGTHFSLGFLANALQAQLSLNHICTPLFQALAAVRDELQRQQEIQMAPLREYSYRMSMLYREAEKVQDVVLDILLERGWCLSYQLPFSLTIRLGELASHNMAHEIDDLMARFAKMHAKKFIDEACQKYPKRAAIIADAFEAHGDGKYSLSIPTLLAQADGIGCEVLDLSRNLFYNEEKLKKAISVKLASLRWPGIDEPFTPGKIHSDLLAPLRRAWSLTRDTSRRSPGDTYSPLNRHGVLHGLDTDYPTEHNSLRCIQLLGYLLDVRQVLAEDIPAELDMMRSFHAE